MATTTYETPAMPCPACREPIDVSTTGQGDPSPPEPGDLTVCGYCHAALRYDKDLKPEVLTPQDIDELPEGHQAQLSAVQEVVKNIPPLTKK